MQKFQLDDVSLRKSGINTDRTIKFLHNSNPEGLLFKIVRGFFDIAICCFAIFLSSLLIKILPISKNGIPSHSFFYRLLSWESSHQILRQFVKFHTMLISLKKARLRKNEVGFLHPKFWRVNHMWINVSI